MIATAPLPDADPARRSPEPLAAAETITVTAETVTVTADSPLPTDRASFHAYLQIIAGLGIVAALWWAQVVLIPVVLSVLLSYALEPLVALLERRRLRRTLAVPIVLLTLVAAIGAGAYLLRGEAVDFVNGIPVAAHKVAQAIRGVGQGAPGPVSRVQAAARELESATKSAAGKDPHDGVTAVRIEEPTFQWSTWLLQSSHNAVEFSGQMFAVICLLYCLMVAGDLYKRKMVHIVPTLSHKKITVEILAEIDRQIERFLVARVIISGVVGVAVWAAFRIAGIGAAGVWGVLSAVLFSIPIVGPVVIVGAAAVAAFAQFGSLGMAATAAGICIAVGALEGNVLTPWLMSRVGEMNTAAVFVSLLFWGWIWGIWGLLLAIPIMAAVKAVCERVQEFSAFAELLKE